MMDLLLVMRGDGLDSFLTHGPRRRIVKITETQNPGHAFVGIDDRQAAYVPVLHQACDLVELESLQAELDACGHDIACALCQWIEAPGEATADDVSVRHHADQSVVLADRNGTDVTLAHRSCERDNGRVRIDPAHTLVHALFTCMDGSLIWKRRRVTRHPRHQASTSPGIHVTRHPRHQASTSPGIHKR